MSNIGSLYHYGILGMKWGRRKAQGPTGNPTSVPRNNSEDHDKKVSLRSKKLNEMTNDELRAFTQRMMLEKQFKELTKPQQGAVKKFVTDFLVTQGKNALNQYVSTYNKKMVDKLIEKTIKDKT